MRTVVRRLRRTSSLIGEPATVDACRTDVAVVVVIQHALPLMLQCARDVFLCRAAAWSPVPCLAGGDEACAAGSA